jgi:hypothetical protein
MSRIKKDRMKTRLAAVADEEAQRRLHAAAAACFGQLAAGDPNGAETPRETPREKLREKLRAKLRAARSLVPPPSPADS